MIREIARTFPHVELRDTWVWFQSGINTDGAHNWATSRRVQRGDILSLNCFPMIAGYYTALERTLFYGEPSAEHLQLWEVNVKAPPRPGADQARCGVQGHRRRAQRDLSGRRSARPSASVLLNGLRVLESFSIAEPVLGVTEIARKVDLHKSSVARIPATLEKAGYVERKTAPATSGSGSASSP